MLSTLYFKTLIAPVELHADFVEKHKELKQQLETMVG